MLGQLARANAAPAAVDALPGWLARRRRTLPPSQEVVDGIAKGPVAYNEPAVYVDAQPHSHAGSAAGPAPRPSPVAGRQAVRSGPHGRGRRPQGHRPDRPDRPQGGRPGQQGTQAGGSSKAGTGAPGKNEGGPGKNGGGQKGSRDRQDGRRGQNRQGRQRRPPRRNG